MSVTILDHPLAGHFLTHLRDKTTRPALFRLLTKRLTLLLALEATRRLPTRLRAIETPLEPFTGAVLGDTLVAVPILRAGLGMLDPIVELFPDVAVGYLGLERDHATAIASSYYAKLPPDIASKTILLLDPMLATGGSACHAARTLTDAGAGQILMLAIVAAPEGVRRMEKEWPDAAIFTAAVDRELSAQAYILPGLGDYGDRLYGTELAHEHA